MYQKYLVKMLLTEDEVLMG